MGAEPCVDEDRGVVAGVMDMGDDVAYTRSETIAQLIASAKRGKAEEMASGIKPSVFLVLRKLGDAFQC